MRELNAVICAHPTVTDEADVKARIARLSSFYIGNQPDNRGFVHVQLQLMAGRSEQAKRRCPTAWPPCCARRASARGHHGATERGCGRYGQGHLLQGPPVIAPPSTPAPNCCKPAMANPGGFFGDAQKQLRIFLGRQASYQQSYAGLTWAAAGCARAASLKQDSCLNLICARAGIQSAGYEPA